MRTVSKVLEELNSLDRGVTVLGNILQLHRRDPQEGDRDKIKVLNELGLTKLATEELWQTVNSTMVSLRCKLNETEVSL